MMTSSDTRPNAAMVEPRMNADAFAGMLQLLLTPHHRDVRPTPELEAYLQHLDVVEPVHRCGPRCRLRARRTSTPRRWALRSAPRVRGRARR